MTPDEVHVADLLGQAATEFAKLPIEHQSDLDEFCKAIHAAQNIVMARDGLRSYRAIKGLSGDWKK